MRGKNFTFRIPPDIYECLLKRIDDLGIKNLSEYQISLQVYDLLVNKPHHATGDIRDQSPAAQDRLFAEVKRAFFAGESIGGSLLENLVKKAVAELALESAPPVSEVGKRIQQILSRKK